MRPPQSAMGAGFELAFHEFDAPSDAHSRSKQLKFCLFRKHSVHRLQCMVTLYQLPVSHVITCSITFYLF